ncbi:MAG: hypothetical protein JWN40_3931 [Phycisphaerales bacterium]|nr:hypothetical protein [Phycisphaerales bacterium]
MIVLLVTLTLGVFYVTAWGKIERLWKKQAGDQSLAALENRVSQERKVGAVKVETLRAYGAALSAEKRFKDAATAFGEVLAMDPGQRDAKFQCGLALAQAGESDAFYNFQKDLVYSEAKLAVELFERPETQGYLAQERFANLSKEAKNQAMD